MLAVEVVGVCNTTGASMRLPDDASLFFAVGAFGLLLLAAGYGLTVFEPQPNRSLGRKGFRWAAAGAVSGGLAGAVIDLAFGLQEHHFTAWGLTVGSLAGAMRARTRWRLPAANQRSDGQ
jgi:hypothetical protein